MFEPTILKKSTAEKRAYEYGELLKQLNHLSERYKELEESLSKHKKGAEGERETAYHLKYLSDDYVIIHDLNLSIGKVSAQVDHLVISPHGFFLIETKKWRNRLEIDENNHWYLLKKDGKKGVKNPHAQSFRHAETIRRFLKIINDRLPITVDKIPFISIAALANIESHVIYRSNEIVEKVDGVAKAIMEYPFEHPPIFSKEDMVAIGKYLLEHDQSINPISRLNIKSENLIQPIIFADGHKVMTPRDFILSMDTHLDEAAQMISDGKIKHWLLSMGDGDGVDFIEKISTSSNNIYVVIEKIAQDNPWEPLSSPVLDVQPDKISLAIEHGESKEIYLNINNKGRGCLYGSVKILDGTYSLETIEFIGSNQMRFKINSKHLPQGARKSTFSILIESNGGSKKVPLNLNHDFSLKFVLNKSLKFGGIYALIAFIGLFFQQASIEPQNAMAFSLFLGLILFAFLIKKKRFLISAFFSIFLVIFLKLLFDQVALFLRELYSTISLGAIDSESGEFSNMFLAFITISLFSLLLAILLKGLPQMYQAIGKRFLSHLSKGAGFALLIMSIVLSVSFLPEKNVISETSNATSDNVIKTAEVIVRMAFKEDTGPEYLYLNTNDIKKYNFKDGQIITVISDNTELRFPVYGRTKVKSGEISMQKSVRDKLRISPGKSVQIKVTN